MALDSFDFIPHGEVKISYEWATEKTESEDGSVKWLRKRIHAKKTYIITIGGRKDDYERLVSFYNSHKGQLLPFIFTYDGIKEVCYFASTLNMKTKFEMKKLVGFTCEISLEVDKQTGFYGVGSENDILPAGHGEIVEEYDWDTTVYTTSSTQRRLKNKKPVRKMSVTFSGRKADRDRLIKLYNTHEMRPLIYISDGKAYKVRFPASITITDYREMKEIVGYKTTIDLEVLDEL